MTKQELVNAVKAHAITHYETDGWDYIVECWTNEDLSEAIGRSRTIEGALKKVRRRARIFDSVRREHDAHVRDFVGDDF